MNDSANKFIACVIESTQMGEIEIECNSIESNANQTLIYGVVEDSGKGYDILIAAIPSSKIVLLKLINE